MQQGGGGGHIQKGQGVAPDLIPFGVGTAVLVHLRKFSPKKPAVRAF